MRVAIGSEHGPSLRPLGVYDAPVLDFALSSKLTPSNSSSTEPSAAAAAAARACSHARASDAAFSAASKRQSVISKLPHGESEASTLASQSVHNTARGRAAVPLSDVV